MSALQAVVVIPRKFKIPSSNKIASTVHLWFKFSLPRLWHSRVWDGVTPAARGCLRLGWRAGRGALSPSGKGQTAETHTSLFMHFKDNLVCCLFLVSFYSRTEFLMVLPK